MKNVVVRPLVPIVWPIQEGINLIQKEVTTLKKKKNSFDCSRAQNLFGSQSFSSSISNVLVMSVHNIVRLANASYWPITCDGKKVKQPSIFKITHQHTNNWEVASYLPNALFSPMLMSFTIFFQMTKDIMGPLEISLMFMCPLCHNVGRFFGWPWGVCAM